MPTLSGLHYIVFDLMGQHDEANTFSFFVLWELLGKALVVHFAAYGNRALAGKETKPLGAYVLLDTCRFCLFVSRWCKAYVYPSVIRELANI